MSEAMPRRTKIICTIGPSSSSKEVLGEIVAAGMDMARINTAYTDNTSVMCKTPLLIDVRSVNRLRELEIPKGSHVALSFVRAASCIRSAREFVRNRIIAKIETREAVENLDEIVRESDMVMIARGDLGKAFGIHMIPMLQEKIISACKRYGKPFIVATEVMKSMIHSREPSRAEAIDIANAVHNDAYAILLADETAIGDYPVESVVWLDRIITTVENPSFSR